MCITDVWYENLLPIQIFLSGIGKGLCFQYFSDEFELFRQWLLTCIFLFHFEICTSGLYYIYINNITLQNYFHENNFVEIGRAHV